MNNKLASGTTVNEKYQIREAIAYGGGGAVYRAIQLDLNREVALKFIHYDLALDENSLQRFEREAKLLASLGNKHLPQIYRTELYAGQVPYLVMELLEGTTLEVELQTKGRLSWTRTAHIAIQICAALEVAHCNGVVHRDLKPANIMLQKAPNGENEDFVKIIDFGLARLISQDGQKSLTATGFILGTPTYMSPEMCGGEKVDQRADVYSLACIMYECISGQAPFNAENPVSLIYKHKTESPLSITEHIQVSERDSTGVEKKSRIEFARKINELILTGLAKSPDKRFSSMKDFAEAINDLGPGNDIQFEVRSKPQINSANNDKHRNRLIMLIAVFVIAIPLAFFLVQIGKPQKSKTPLNEGQKSDQLNKSAEQLLNDVRESLKKATKASAAKKEIEAKRFSRRALRQMCKELTSARDQKKLWAKEFQLIQDFSKFEKYLVVMVRRYDGREMQEVEGISAAIDLERRKNRGFHNEAALQLLESTINWQGEPFQLWCSSENFAKAGDFAAAESTLNRAAIFSKDPEAPRVKRVRAIIELKKGNLAKFHEMANEEKLAITNNSRNGGWSQLGEMYIEAGELKEAKECFLNEIKIPVKNEIEHILPIAALAKMYEKEKNYPKALEYYEQARNISKDNFFIGNQVEYSKTIDRLQTLLKEQDDNR